MSRTFALVLPIVVFGCGSNSTSSTDIVDAAADVPSGVDAIDATDATPVDAITIRVVELRSGSPKPIAGAKAWLYFDGKEPLAFTGDADGVVTFSGYSLETIQKSTPILLIWAKDFGASLIYTSPSIGQKPDRSPLDDKNFVLFPRLGKEGFIGVSGTAKVPSAEHVLSVWPSTPGTFYQNYPTDWKLKVAGGRAFRLTALAFTFKPEIGDVLIDQTIARWVSRDFPGSATPLSDVALDLTTGGEPTTKFSASIDLPGGAKGPLATASAYTDVRNLDFTGGFYGVATKVTRRADKSGFEIEGESIDAKDVPVSTRYSATLADGSYSMVIRPGRPTDKEKALLPTPLATSIARFALSDPLELPSVTPATPTYRSLQMPIRKGQDTVLTINFADPKRTTVTLPKLPDEVASTLSTPLTATFESCIPDSKFATCIGFTATRSINVVR